jgi:hypothetical protein
MVIIALVMIFAAGVICGALGALMAQHGPFNWDR